MPPGAQPTPAPGPQRPTCTNVRIRSVGDAHKIFFAVHTGLLPMVARRLDADERAALHTGCVYAWEERSPNTEITGIGIERFTEGRRWSASRVRDEFLFYYEKWVGVDASQPLDEGSLPASKAQSRAPPTPPPGWQQLVKQTYSVWVETPKGKRKWHLTAYFTQQTVDHLGTVDDIPELQPLNVPRGMFTSTRVGKRKNTVDAEGSAQQAPARVYAPFPTPHAPLAPRPTQPEASTSSAAPHPARGPPSPSVTMHDPYARARAPTPQSGAGPYDTAAYRGGTPTPTPTPHRYARPEAERGPASPVPGGFVPPEYVLHPDARRMPYQAPLTAVSGGWFPASYAAPPLGSPHSDASSPGSSSSAGSSPSSYPLVPSPMIYTPYPAGDDDDDAGRRYSLPRVASPTPEPDPLAVPMDDRPGGIGPCRDLAPLHSLTRMHPYRRDPADDQTLRLLRSTS